MRKAAAHMTYALHIKGILKALCVVDDER